MSPSQPSNGATARLPAMIAPKILEFDMTNKSKHKKFLTVYNTYDVPLHYKIRCTSRKAFTLQGAHGTLKPNSSYGVAISLNPSAVTDIGKTKFKFEVSCWDDKKNIEGVTVATAYINVSTGTTVLPWDGTSTAETLSGHSGEEGEEGTNSTASFVGNVSKRRGLSRASSPAVLFTAALLAACLVVLLSPFECVSEDAKKVKNMSVLPVVSHTEQLLAAFILGLVTMTILHTHSRTPGVVEKKL
eukprot:CFRG4130T1